MRHLSDMSMLEYLKNMMQLLLMPTVGWEAVERSPLQAGEIDHRGFYPWLGVVFISQFVALFYGRGVKVIELFESAIVVAGAMYASLFLAKLILDLSLSNYVEGGVVEPRRVAVFSSYMVGLDCLFRFVENLMPTPLTFLFFLPLLGVSVVFKGASYLGIKESVQITFTLIATVATIVVPLGLTSILLLFV